MRKYRILHNTKLKAQIEDVETLLHHVLSGHAEINLPIEGDSQRRSLLGALVKKQYLNDAKTIIQLHFCFPWTLPDEHENDEQREKYAKPHPLWGKEPIHPAWGGVELIAWSDGITEIIRMWQNTPLGGTPKFFPKQFLNGEDEAAEQLESLEIIGDILVEKFGRVTENPENQNVKQSGEEASNILKGHELKAIWAVPVDWDVLVSASHSCIDGYAPGFVNKEIINQLPASIKYRIWQRELGELGTIEIRKLRVGFSQIEASGIPMGAERLPNWEQTAKELQGKSREMINKALKNKKQQEQERRERLKDHQGKVISAYFNRLIQEVEIWKPNYPPPYILAIGGITSVEDAYRRGEYFGEFIKGAWEAANLLNANQSTSEDVVEVINKARQQGKSGRPHLPEDVWAWEQVNIYNRPSNEVYKEWHGREDVQARDLQDSKRQFNRIIKPEWGNKSGQNI